MPGMKGFLNRIFERSVEDLRHDSSHINFAHRNFVKGGVKERLAAINNELWEAANHHLAKFTTLQDVRKSSLQLDVAESLYLLGLQLAFARLSEDGRCPVLELEGEYIPILNYEFVSDTVATSDDFAEIRWVDDNVIRGPDEMPFKQSKVVSSEIPALMEGPLSRFLFIRLWNPSVSGGAPTANVEVHNNQNGWQVIYSPAYLQRQIGLGGPSTPVKGYVGPGTYRFGITKAGSALWDPTHWNIPASSPIFLPLP